MTEADPPDDREGPPGAERKWTAPRLMMDGAFGQRPVYAHNELQLTGWVIASDPVEHVFVEIDGNRYTARHGLASPELSDRFPHLATADRARFEFVALPLEIDPGSHVVRLTAHIAGGAVAETSGRVEFLPFENPGFNEPEYHERIAAGKPIMWVQRPWLDGSETDVPVLVEGWAYSPSTITSVVVFVDGITRANAIHGFLHAEQRDLLGADARTSGFALTLNREECGLGAHDLTVVAIDTAGNTAGYSGSFSCREADDDRDLTPPETLTDERYVPEAHGGLSLEAEHQARYRWVSPLAAGRRVLDAGCGTGFGSEILLTNGPVSVDAFDLNQLAIDDARRRLGDRATVILGDLRAIPFDDDQFDLVVCFEAIEHIADPSRGIAELARVLAPGGVLAISTPNRGVYPPGNPHHLWEFNASEFREALEVHFRQVQVWRQDSALASLIVDDDAFEVSDPSAPLELDVRKVRGGPRDSELYTVALASHDVIPQLRGMGVLGDSLDQASLIAERDSWRRRSELTADALAEARLEPARLVAAARDADQQREVAERAWQRADDALTQAVTREHGTRAELEAELRFARAAHDQAVRERDEALQALARPRTSWLRRKQTGTQRPPAPHG